MDKFVLYMDDGDRYRVRLHRFKTRRQNGSAVERVHSHKWGASTVILEGGYTERQFRVVNLDEATGAAQVELARVHELQVGAVNSLPLLVPHQVINYSDDAPCLTLFVRGRSFYDRARIFLPDENRFYYTYSRDEQIRHGLDLVSQLRTDFH